MARFIQLHNWADGSIIIINKDMINSVCRHFDGKRTTIILSKDVVYVKESVDEIYKLLKKWY
jgi:hypothetical protein